MIRCVNPKDPNTVTTTFTAPAQEYPEEAFRPIEMQHGSLLLIHGSVVHRSHANTSAKSRHAYTMHVIEGDGPVYDHLNWLQPSPALAFPPL